MDEGNSNGLSYKTTWQSAGLSKRTLYWAQLLCPDAYGFQRVWLELHAYLCSGEEGRVL